jgi:DNA polymerase-1
MADKLFLIDGHALIFKMYYAFLRRPMVNSKGADMSILFGFTKYLLELIEREKPTHLAMSFDLPGGTFRNELYPQYKATRKETPQLVIDALDPLIEICKAMNIPIIAVKGYEADDVIGSMAKRSGKEGFLVYMVTPDKDYGQLIDENIFQYKPGKSGSENEIIGRKEICEKYGITDPSQVIDMLTICGDTSDNVPGVKGIGEVGASKLIAKYGSVKNIYDHLDELGEKQRKMFEEAKDHIELSHTLVTIKTDIPLDITGDEMRINMDFNPEIANLFRKYEFNSLEKYISHIKNQAKAEQKKTMPQINETGTMEIYKAASAAGNCAIITEGAGQGIFTSVRKITVAAFPGQKNAERGIATNRILAADGSEKDFKKLLEDEKISKFGFDLKQQIDIMAGNGITIKGKLFDIGLLHYLLDPEKSHRQDILAKSYLDINLSENGGTAVEVSGNLFADEESEEPVQEQRKYEEAAVDLLLGEKITAEVAKDERTADLYDKMEEPLIRVLSKMELNGVKVDLEQLRLYAESLKKELAEREDKIREMTGEPDLNVSSPKQIGEALFGKLGLDTKAKKNKNGSYSTDEATLSALSYKNPVIDEILEFRAVKKLLSTYIEPFPGYISPITGKIHTTFNQALTSTGRLSSSNPNLQNIPIRSERGKEIRKAFIPGTTDGIILSADYSQIELRIMAHLSNDTHLISAFNAGKDIHAATASKIFGIPHEQVTPEQRRIAKMANFGIMYGISAFGLSQRLGISRNEAKKIIDDYFASFPAISSFIERTLSDARKNGYVETLFGRRRYLPDINSKNATIRALAERNAVNAPIQGTSADIIKMAMIGVNNSMEEAGLKSKMVLQIHDELVFDALPEEIERLRGIVVFQMENVIKLSVPLTVECNYGKNWLEAH